MIDRTLKIALAFAATALAARAQDAKPSPSAPAADTSSIILAPKAAEQPGAPIPVQASPDKPASAGISKVISSGMPAYSPELAAPKPATPSTDVRETDKPRNQIPRLPLEVMSRYVVREARLPEFRTRDLYTKAGLIDLSFKEHPGLRLGNIFNLNAPYALETVREEQELEAKNELSDLAFAMSIGGDSEQAATLKGALIDESYEAAAGQGGPVGVK